MDGQRVPDTSPRDVAALYRLTRMVDVDLIEYIILRKTRSTEFPPGKETDVHDPSSHSRRSPRETSKSSRLHVWKIPDPPISFYGLFSRTHRLNNSPSGPWSCRRRRDVQLRCLRMHRVGRIARKANGSELLRVSANNEFPTNFESEVRKETWRA